MQVYFRKDIDTMEEFEDCAKLFHTVDRRTALTPKDKLLRMEDNVVICRYSALPYNKELEADLHSLGLQPINSSRAHSYIANMDWIHDLGDLTFRTWDRLQDVPENIPVIVKGRTNSKKFEWDTKMFASNRREAAIIAGELMKDPLIGPQGVVYREYNPLVTYEIGLNGMPMTNEWRVFFMGDVCVSWGYYWTSLDDMSRVEMGIAAEGLALAQKAAKIVCEHANFFVIDVAQKQDGSWVVVEVNDGQMSGLSAIYASTFYQSLSLAYAMALKNGSLTLPGVSY